MIGTLSSSNSFSSIKFTGSAIASPFVTTTSNQQIVTLTGKGGNILRANAVTITAGTADLYVSLSKYNENLASYAWTNDPVFYIPAETSMSFNGLEVSHIRFSNNSGAQYLIQAFTF